ncbi:MAG: restriction endonuclease [Planctomycetes bacterium]|nr:restriction endonuclease [Planctomycetota bacterium]
MALWLVRTGKHGQHEQKFLRTNRVYATWEGLNHNLADLPDLAAVQGALQETFPDASRGRLANWSGQLWSFSHDMKPGDWVAVPLRSKPAIAFGEIAGPYEYDGKADDPYYHSRKVKWLNTDVPRSVFDQDLLYSFGAFMTVCEIRRNDAENRVRTLAGAGWRRPDTKKPTQQTDEGEGREGEKVDLERLARDQIAMLITSKLMGHGMALLVEALLKAQGYTTFRSPEGPDQGVDILAAPGPLGFGCPRIAVQVKSGDSPVDRPTLDQLIGAMQNVNADQGLLVSWGGFKSSVDKETAHHFFRVRLWDQDDLIDQLLEQYANLDEDLRAELPLKRIWTVASQEEEA